MLGEYSGQTVPLAWRLVPASVMVSVLLLHALMPSSKASFLTDSELASSGPWLSVLVLIGPYFTSQVLLLSAGPITVSGTNAPASRVLQLGVLMRRPRRSPRFSPDSCFDVD